MPTFTDPFTEIERKLWELVASHSGVIGLVKTGNRMDEQDLARNAQKDGHLGADLPELRLIPTGGSVLGMTSTSLRIAQAYDFQVLTGSERPHRQMFPVRWQLIRAYTLTRDDPTWEHLGLSYVTDLKLLTFNDVQNGVQADKDKLGWLSALRFQAELCLDKVLIKSQEAPI